MKIEVIEKKAPEAKETPFVVGGVYFNRDTFYYVLTETADEKFALTFVGSTQNDFDAGEPDTYLHNTRDQVQEIIDRFDYVPNARLVIDLNDN